MATDDVTLNFNGEDSELSAVLDRIQARITTVEDKLDKLNVAGRAAGDGIDAGMDKAAKATDKAGRAAETASPKIAKAGDSAASAGAKAAAGSSGFDDFAKKVEKANKSTGGFGSITKSFKFGSIATGIYALAGAISAAGAASVIGIAHLAPLLLNVLNFAPAALAAAASMAVFKLTATQLAGPLNEIKSEFSGLGNEIAKGGLLTGVSALANDLKPLSKVTGGGLTEIGAQLGFAASQLGSFAKQSSTLSSVKAIFAGLDPIVHDVLQGLLSLLPGALALIKAIEPSTQAMAHAFAFVADELSLWVKAESDNGTVTRVMIDAWNKLHDAGLIVWDVVVGLFNIFKIAAGVTAGFGGSILDLTRKFRDWTSSTSGQASIAKYFTDALPAIHQLIALVGNVVSLLAHVASGSNIAPLLGMINGQLVPALAGLLGHLTALGGVGPSLVTVVSNLAKLAGGLSFSSFTSFAGALASFSNWLVWAQANIPGFNQLLSVMLGLFLSFKVIAPIIVAINNAMKLMTAIGVVTAAISSGLETLGIVGLYAMDGLAAAADFAAGAIDAAFVATPIGWIVLAIVAVIAIIVLLWEKCAWFRDAVEAVWGAIRVAAVAVWNFIKQAAIIVFDAIVAYIKTWVMIVTVVIGAIVIAAKAVWSGLVVAWKAVWSVLSPIVSAVWTVIKFIVQVVVYIIIGLITLMALAAQGAWWLISTGALWLWNTIIKPIFTFIAALATWLWTGIVTEATLAWNLLSVAVQWFWNMILHPIFLIIASVATWVWGGIVTAANFCWQIISSAAQWLWNTILHPIFSLVASVGSTIWTAISDGANVAWQVIKGVWSVVSGWFSGLWSGISNVAKSAWTGISDAISVVGKVVSGVWNTIVGAIKAVWNFIAKGWNSIPNITVPSWVPGLGGKSFGLPKLPTLYTGGPTPGGPALVGEHGPELLVRGGRVTGVLGAGGPEVVPNLPRGGYVVPNAATITAGMAKKIPMPIASAIARTEQRGSGDHELLGAVRELSAVLRDRPPALAVSGGADTHKSVLSALREHDREQEAKGRYKYKAGQT